MMVWCKRVTGPTRRKLSTAQNFDLDIFGPCPGLCWPTMPACRWRSALLEVAVRPKPRQIQHPRDASVTTCRLRASMNPKSSQLWKRLAHSFGALPFPPVPPFMSDMIALALALSSQPSI